MEQAGFGGGGFSLTYISASQSQHSCQGMWGYADPPAAGTAALSMPLRLLSRSEIVCFRSGTVAENRLCGEARAREIKCKLSPD